MLIFISACALEAPVGGYDAGRDASAFEVVATYASTEPQAVFGAELDLGDVTGDGVTDLAVAAPYATRGGFQTGVIYVFAGPLTGGGIDDADALLFPPAEDIVSTVEIGDADGDGIGDLWVGGEGRSWIVTGPVSGVVDLGARRSVTGELRAAGDVDGDGDDDALAVLGDGRASLLLDPPTDADPGRLVAAATFPEGALPAGDLDEDGLADVAYGWWWDPETSSTDWHGQVELHFAPFSASGAADRPDAIVRGAGGERLAGAVAAGDADGDGDPDLLFAADNGPTRIADVPPAGEHALADLAVGRMREGKGRCARPLGDVDGDGRGDFGLGDPEWPPRDPDSSADGSLPGRLWIAWGPVGDAGTVVEPVADGTSHISLCELHAHGDVTGDGAPDLVYADAGYGSFATVSAWDAGRVFVVTPR